jgi:hypothetical protein
MTAMTRREASDLISVVKMRAKVTKAAVDALAAERQADVERQLSTIHTRDDALWAEIVAALLAATKIADAEIAVICARGGIRKEFRPRIGTAWNGRGENTLPARRVELRKRAYTRIEADQKKAYQQIDAWAADRCTALVSGQLTSDDAKSFFDSLPSAEILLPPVAVRAELGDGASESIEVKK